jgi:hypothetical protein
LIGLSTGVHSLIYKQIITQIDLYTTALPASPGVTKELNTNLKLTVKSCSDAIGIGFLAQSVWITSTLGLKNGPNFEIILPN